VSFDGVETDFVMTVTVVITDCCRIILFYGITLNIIVWLIWQFMSVIFSTWEAITLIVYIKIIFIVILIRGDGVVVVLV